MDVKLNRIDYEAVKDTLGNVKGMLDEMRILINAHEKGGVSVSDVVVTYSAAQNTAIIDRYNALKAALVAEYANLP